MIKIIVHKDNSGLHKIPVPGKPGMYRLEGPITEPRETRRSYNELVKKLMGKRYGK